jgi:hypothetical protein
LAVGKPLEPVAGPHAEETTGHTLRGTVDERWVFLFYGYTPDKASVVCLRPAVFESKRAP